MVDRARRRVCVCVPQGHRGRLGCLRKRPSCSSALRAPEAWSFLGSRLRFGDSRIRGTISGHTLVFPLSQVLLIRSWGWTTGRADPSGCLTTCTRDKVSHVCIRRIRQFTCCTRNADPLAACLSLPSARVWEVRAAVSRRAPWPVLGFAIAAHWYRQMGTSRHARQRHVCLLCRLLPCVPQSASHLGMNRIGRAHRCSAWIPGPRAHLCISSDDQAGASSLSTLALSLILAHGLARPRRPARSLDLRHNRLLRDLAQARGRLAPDAQDVERAASSATLSAISAAHGLLVSPVRAGSCAPLECHGLRWTALDCAGPSLSLPMPHRNFGRRRHRQQSATRGAGTPNLVLCGDHVRQRASAAPGGSRHSAGLANLRCPVDPLNRTFQQQEVLTASRTGRS